MAEHLTARRVTGRTLVFRGTKVLLFERRRFDWRKLKWLKYYSIPGGGANQDEEADEAARRELKEEMGVTVELGRKLAVAINHRFEHHLFAGTLVDGEPEPSLQESSEEAQRMHRLNRYLAVWVEVSELTASNMLYYAPFLPIIKRVAAGDLPDEPVQLELK